MLGGQYTVATMIESMLWICRREWLTTGGELPPLHALGNADLNLIACTPRLASARDIEGASRASSIATD